ncbi:MAG: biopolymer transporter ExbD [Sphingomonadales bacterium]
MAMRKHGMKQVSDATIDLTPMLDVVFIMLIFFIVTATFVKEAGIQVTKPETVTAEIEPSTTITVAITANNDVYIERQRYSPDAVRAVIERLYAENPKGTVVIIPDENATVETYGRVQDAVKQAGVEKIVMATEKSE